MFFSRVWSFPHSRTAQENVFQKSVWVSMDPPVIELVKASTIEYNERYSENFLITLCRSKKTIVHAEVFSDPRNHSQIDSRLVTNAEHVGRTQTSSTCPMRVERKWHRNSCECANREKVILLIFSRRIFDRHHVKAIWCHSCSHFLNGLKSWH
jgi:hypothetical protein